MGQCLHSERKGCDHRFIKALTVKIVFMCCFFFLYYSSILNSWTFLSWHIPGPSTLSEINPFKKEISHYVGGFAFEAWGMIVFMFSTAQNVTRCWGHTSYSIPPKEQRVSKTILSTSLQPPNILLFFDQHLNGFMHRVPGFWNDFLHNLRCEETAVHAVWSSSFRFTPSSWTQILFITLEMTTRTTQRRHCHEVRWCHGFRFGVFFLQKLSQRKSTSRTCCSIVSNIHSVINMDALPDTGCHVFPSKQIKAKKKKRI